MDAPLVQPLDDRRPRSRVGHGRTELPGSALRHLGAVSDLGLLDRVGLGQGGVLLGLVHQQDEMPVQDLQVFFTETLGVDQPVARAPPPRAINSLSLSATAFESLFWARWIRKTIRNVTMVVVVLITSCQVSE